jgi:calcium-binding protein P
MKRLLAIALAFLTLVAGALLAPTATAAGKVETKLLFALNDDGSFDELAAVYGSEDVINSSNCKDTKEYISKFTQKDGKNQCIFAKHYEKDSYANNWTVYQSGDTLKFNFLNLTAFIRSDVSEALGIYYSDLNVISSGAAVPLNATVTDQSLSPTVDKSDKFVYYTWEGSDATNSSASLKGTLPLSGATSNPTSNPTNTPTNTPEPALTATASATPSAAATGATATALAAKHNSNDSNTTLYVVLGIAAAAALIGVVVTVVLVKKRKSSTPTPGFYPPASPTMPYNGPYPGPQAQQGYRGPQQPQGYPGAQQQGYPGPQQPHQPGAQPQRNQPRPGQPPYGANPNYPQNRN